MSKIAQLGRVLFHPVTQFMTFHGKATVWEDLNFAPLSAGSPAGDIVDWGVVVNTTKYVSTYSRRTLSTGSVWDSFGGGGIIPMSTGDTLFMFFNSDDTNALTHRVGSIRLHQV